MQAHRQRLIGANVGRGGYRNAASAGCKSLFVENVAAPSCQLDYGM
jgi:hypothetical protein